MVNAAGLNGKPVIEYPPDDLLIDAFNQYARENSGAGLGVEDQLARLELQFKLIIEKSSLYRLRKRLGIESVRKPKRRTEIELRQVVVDLKAGDVSGGWGVTQTKGRLANSKEHILIPRDTLRLILHDEYEHEFDNRFVGKKKKLKHRVPLKALGPYHQEHSDGHEKMSEQGLNIGAGIHLPIYGSKDQFGAFVHALLLMPNVRNAQAIAHYYLDLVENRGCLISMQLTTDMGNEVNEMHKIHQALRDEVAPEFVPPQWPHSIKESSTDNTPIEGFWRWLRNGEGHSTKMTIQSGAASGIFLPHDAIHRQTFYWLWVPLLQEGLDRFREYWNNHKLKNSKGKLNAAGSSPRNMLLNPTSVVATAVDVSIRVNRDSIHRLREAYGGAAGRDKAFRFVSREFAAEADGAYVDLGCPAITLLTAWSVFEQVVAELNKRIDVLE
ncbi:hypothetical protein B0H16DRAFT_66451 [Mycena metata]|uniref:Uncharacterized protein n=1 Tax=Mycena metata TaxID=1033252 RepID=A0AAD7ID90_9AGAR|nr:hypothetical protein B0H16DRAFT_66451 [Mycena metata]